MASWPLSVWEGDRLIYCLLEKFLSPLPQVPLVWCSPQGTCNLGLTVTLREAGTSEMVLPCQYLQLVCCVWVSNCLSLIQSLIVFFWQLWGYAGQPAVCFIISLGILLLLAIYETGVLPWHWASSFWPFILFAFWGFTYAISPPRMPSLRAPCMCDHRGFCTKKGTELALMLTLNVLLFLFSCLNFWIKASAFLFYTGFHKLYSLSCLSLVRWWIFKAQLRNNNQLPLFLLPSLSHLFLALVPVARRICSCPMEITFVLILKASVGKNPVVK